MSLRIVPPTTHASQTSNTTGGRNHSSFLTTATSGPASSHPKGAPSAPGLPDTLRANLTRQAPIGPPSSHPYNTEPPVSTHPLEARLKQWRATQDALKMETLRRTFGMAEPIRRQMELKIVRDSEFRPMVLGGGRSSSVHEDILVIGGRDTEIDWEDVFTGDEFREPPSFHDEMEKRLRMDW
ncbi:hypothetical protein VTN31DRAFT_238 [Thermomyces dupontii]|uniref:uncharacterized protein n=1 Tax=Talaromyces thermophilus TaxID=28565 RepID=UPI0037426846